MIISDHDSLTTRGNAILACVGYGKAYVNITWRRNGHEVSTVSSYFSEKDFVFDGMLFKLSLLWLCEQQSSHMGDYNCVVSNKNTGLNQIHTVESSAYLSFESDCINDAWIIKSYVWDF